MRKCYLCRQFMNARELFVNNCLSKFVQKKKTILHAFRRRQTKQLSVIPAMPLTSALCEDNVNSDASKMICFVTFLNLTYS